MPIPVETAAGPGISGKMFSAPGVLARVERFRWTGEVAAEKILLLLDADGGSAHTPWHRVRGSTGTCRGVGSCDLRLGSWPAGGRGCRGSQDQAASEWPRRPRTAPRAARKDVRGARRSRRALIHKSQTRSIRAKLGREPGNYVLRRLMLDTLPLGDLRQRGSADRGRWVRPFSV